MTQPTQIGLIATVGLAVMPLGPTGLAGLLASRRWLRTTTSSVWRTT
jgi:hypothetical protein